MKKIENIIWGLILITLAVILGLNSFGITDIQIFFDGWWTLIIIVPCFIGLLKNRSKLGNLIGLSTGILLLLNQREILTFDLLSKLVVPGILLIIGLNLIFKNTFTKFKNVEIKGKEKENYSAVFSSQKIELKEINANRIKTEVVFGAIRLNLREAELKDNMMIESGAIFGNILINVPEDVNVKIISTSIFGTVTDRVKRNYVENNKTICINATTLFGGVNIICKQ